MSDRPTLGIIGGCGSVATTDIIATIQEHTPVEVEQDHFPILADIDATLPSRVAAIEGTGPPVESQLVENAQQLDEWGAEYLIIGSNTTHYFHDAIDAATDATVLHLPELAMAYCDDRGFESVTVLGTTACRDEGIYHDAAAATDVTVTYPESLDLTMDVIYTFKDGDERAARSKFRQLVEELGPEASPLVLGCTELSVFDVPRGYMSIDPVEILVDHLLTMEST